MNQTYLNRYQKIGKFFVLEGIDGSGKTTQIKILKEKLEEIGYRVIIVDFPQYNKKSAGAIEEYLSGKYGESKEVSPYVASCFYAVDRFDASLKIKKWIQNGFIVLGNRYVTSNMAHQGSKIENPLERLAFYEWIQNLEYKIFKIPKPDRTFILNMDSHLSQNLSQKRHRIDWMGKVRDIHEENLEHLSKSQKIFLEIKNKFANMELIECSKNGQILNRNEIHEILFRQIRNYLKDDFPNFLNTREYNGNIKQNNIQQKKKEIINIISSEYISLEQRDKIIIETENFINASKNINFIIPEKSLVNNSIYIENNFIEPGFEGKLKLHLKNNGFDIYNIRAGEVLGRIYC